MLIVPTTTRTLEQYQRIDLGIGPFPYALVCNGGVLLINGVPDEAWYQDSLHLVSDSREEMNLAMELLEREPRRKFELRYIEKLFIFTKCNDPETVVNDLKTSLDTKYVDVFVYQGFDDVCVETSGNTTLFTVNPNWAGLKVSFKGKNGKTVTYNVSVNVEQEAQQSAEEQTDQPVEQ